MSVLSTRLTTALAALRGKTDERAALEADVDRLTTEVAAEKARADELEVAFELAVEAIEELAELNASSTNPQPTADPPQD